MRKRTMYMHTTDHTLHHRWELMLHTLLHHKAMSSTQPPTLFHPRQPTTTHLRQSTITDTRQTTHNKSIGHTILPIIPHLRQQLVLPVADTTNVIPALTPILAILLLMRLMLVTHATLAIIAAGRVQNM